MKPVVNIMWFRRDLRLHDNAALYYALTDTNPVLPVFIFDKNILDKLEDKTDKRVNFIYSVLVALQQQLVELGSSFEIMYATPIEAFEKLLLNYTIKKVFANSDYEQYAKDREVAIEQLLSKHHATIQLFKDQVIFEKDEIVKNDGMPYTVFTPYSRKWKEKLSSFFLQTYHTEKYFYNFYKQQPQKIIAIHDFGFISSATEISPAIVDENSIKKYSDLRNYPALNGTSKLSVHLRFGTISIRQLAAKALQLNEVFLNELIWRDFYQMILWHFPHINKGLAFKKQYDLINWRNNETEFKLWCEGKTGYPIVDAGMRELNETGFMHNRVRMIVASFLVKHLLIDWRWGEAYFAKKLLDFDFASNNGGWQWAAGSGCDAAPYFRIFNPLLQTKKFDKDLQYVRKWVPELDSFQYPQPIVIHEKARTRCLQAYAEILQKVS